MRIPLKLLFSLDTLNDDWCTSPQMHHSGFTEKFNNDLLIFELELPFLESNSSTKTLLWIVSMVLNCNNKLLCFETTNVMSPNRSSQSRWSVFFLFYQCGQIEWGRGGMTVFSVRIYICPTLEQRQQYSVTLKRSKAPTSLPRMQHSSSWGERWKCGFIIGILDLRCCECVNVLKGEVNDKLSMWNSVSWNLLQIVL